MHLVHIDAPQALIERSLSMKCPRCNSLTRHDHEHDKLGWITVLACIICGWRGKVVEDERIRFSRD